ncbi:MAG: carboxypeptidase M32, partial [Nitrospirae bacterium]
RPFWQYFYPLLQHTFPDQMLAVAFDDLYAALNIVKPSYIRVDADELTYNLHIMLRFEIERDLLEDRVRLQELPQLWRDKMKSYLGVVPPTDREGVLQDVHWSIGAIGYFPTYTLGNLYAVQFFNQARRALPDLPDRIARGDLLSLKAWLNKHIHRWGRLYTADELVRRVTGEPLTPDHFLAYLEHKYGELYKL